MEKDTQIDEINERKQKKKYNQPTERRWNWRDRVSKHFGKYDKGQKNLTKQSKENKRN